MASKRENQCKINSMWQMQEQEVLCQQLKNHSVGVSFWRKLEVVLCHVGQVNLCNFCFKVFHAAIELSDNKN